MNKSRESYIDVVRGLAIVLVVLGHLGMPITINSFIYGFHMPLFFLLSGYLYTASKWTATPFFQFIRLKARAYLLPYALLGFINLVTNFFIEYMQLSSADLFVSTKGHLSWLILSNDVYGSAPNCEALWFLPCFFFASLGFYIIEKQSAFKRSVLFILLCAMQIFFIWCKFQLPWHLNILPICILFMSIGQLFKVKNLLELPAYAFGIAAILGILGISLNPIDFDLNHMSFGNIPLALCGSIGMGYAILYACRRWFSKNRLLELYGRNTLLIMGLHMLLSSLVLLVLNRIPPFVSYGYHWWFNAILVLLLLIPLCLCRKQLRKSK